MPTMGKNKNDKLNRYICAAADCASSLKERGIVNPDESPNTFFLYVIGAMRCFAAEGFASRHPEYADLPELFRIGDESEICVPDMLLDELKYLIQLGGERRLKNDPDLLCLLICYVAYFNSILNDEDCRKLEKKLFKKIERLDFDFSQNDEIMYSSALWFSDRYGFRELFLAHRNSAENSHS